MTAVLFLDDVALSQNMDRKIGNFEKLVHRQQIVYVVAGSISTLFGLFNLLFAFYNLFLLTTTVNRRLKGMTMKINLSEKALLERRLPTDIMSSLSFAKRTLNTLAYI
uniref:ABC transmembrane type-1 domain-containing protein n=1 Tax=Angiostrongylus cantonensis TaxID=6313 RepID=A0A0K0D0H3_ANGCA